MFACSGIKLRLVRQELLQLVLRSLILCQHVLIGELTQQRTWFPITLHSPSDMRFCSVPCSSVSMFLFLQIGKESLTLISTNQTVRRMEIQFTDIIRCAKVGNLKGSGCVVICIVEFPAYCFHC